MQLRWRWRAAHAQVEGELSFGPNAEGLPGHIHGGALAAVCDEAMGWACWCSGWIAPGARVETAFLAAVRPGQALTLVARVSAAQGRKIATVAELFADGRAVAQASGLYIAIVPKDLAAFAQWPGVDRFAGNGR